MIRKVHIEEIKRRSEQGRTRPFLCRADDGNWYWVKGNDAGKAGLCYEWLAGRMAKAMGLPIPSFAQVEVQRELVELSAISDIEALGAGTAFGSQHVAGVTDLAFSQICDVSVELRRKVLAFDWLVQNEDRILGERGGNVNILWEASEGAAHIIDHNLSFDPTFDIGGWRANHVFQRDLDDWTEDITVEIEPLLRDTCTQFEEFWEELPEQWLDAAELLPDFSKERCLEVLERYSTADSLFGGVTR